MPKKNAIALLITMFFIMAITVAIGLNLKNINKAKQEVNSENFLLQSRTILNDILKILKNTPELNDINDSDSFRTFLQTYTTMIPLSKNIMLNIDLKSARAKFNINALKDNNATKEAISSYFNSYMINNQYIGILEDLISGIKKDGEYNSGIFNDKPYLFRDYINSFSQIEDANEYYKQNYHDNSVDKLNLSKIFYFLDGNNSNYTIDLNFVNRDVFNIMSGVFENNSKDENQSDDFFVDCNSLSNKQKTDFKNKFHASCDLQKIIDVKLSIMGYKQKADIEFEYDIKTKKGSKFVYKI